MSRTILRIALVLAVFGLAASAASAATYELTLQNGSVIQTRYRPVDAPFSTELYQLMTTVGNWMVIPKADVVSIATSSRSRCACVGSGSVHRTSRPSPATSRS